MLNQHCHLLSRNKGLEIFPRLSVVVRLNLRDGTMPDDATGNRKEIFHELALTGDLNVDGAFAQTGSLVLVAIVAVDDIDGIIKREHLNVGIMRLARDSFHDNMNRLQVVVEDPGVFAEDSDDLRTRRGVRDLGRSISKFLV
jgi:hypothetical protein